MKLRAAAATIVIGWSALSATASPLVAQQPDSAATPRASFAGRIASALDSLPVRSVEVRLLFIDSTRTARTKAKEDSLEIFVDTARSRVAVTDSAGQFILRRLLAGSYLMQIRRIGFQPIEGAVTVDTGSVRADFAMEVTSRLLAKVIVKETSVDVVKRRLDRVGYLERSHLGISATFIDRKEILRQKRQTVAEILSTYGIHDGDILLDRMPLDFESLRDYPADLVIGIEIYRHGRPTEFNGTRRGPSLLSPGGMAASRAPMILIWTFIP